MSEAKREIKKKMVIHCASGINNSGDEAILEVLVDRYSSEFDISVISLNASNTKYKHHNIYVCENGAKECRAIIEACDVFILGGGGLLQDETTVFNLFRWLKYLKLALKMNKFTMLYANSIGPLNYAVSRSCVASVLKKVNLITLRDESSRAMLDKMGIENNVFTTSDPVFSFKVDFEQERYQQIQETYSLPEKYVCFAVRHWYDTIPFIPVSMCTRFGLRRKKDVQRYERYVHNLVRIVEYCNTELKLPVVFVSFLVNRDNKVAKDVLSKSKNAINVCINDSKLSCTDVFYIINGAHLLVGMRLHSIIYAIKCKTPFVGISYSSKVEGILKKYQLQDCMMQVDSFDLNEFCSIYDKMKFEDMIQHLEDVMRIAEKEELENERLFRKYYGKVRK